MYFIDELVKEHQKELLCEAKAARRFRQLEKSMSKFQVSLRARISDFLIAGGLRLKR